MRSVSPDERRACPVTPTEQKEPKTWGSCWDHFGRHLVELVGIRPGSRVLDVGSGGGASLYPAAEKVGPRGMVVGIETCNGCFERTSAEIDRCGVSNAKLLYMDARKMNFEDDSFDFVISGFIGWDDYFDFDSCKPISNDQIMSEIHRVLRSGGRVGITGWAVHEEDEILRDLLYEYLPSDSPHRKGIRGWSHRETAEGWQAILSNAGFVDITTLIENHDKVYASESEWWTSSADGDWKEVMEDLEKTGVVTVDSLREHAFDMLHRYKRTGVIHQARNAVLAIGTKA